MFWRRTRGAAPTLALLAVAFAATPARAYEEINSFDQPRVTDETGKITVEASIVHVVACSGAGENGGQYYVFEYRDRPGFRAIAPPDWGTPIGGEDFDTYEQAVQAACGIEAPTTGEASLGCYRDDRARDLDGSLTSSPTNTPAECIASCRDAGFAYAGVQAGSQCLCGDTYGTYGTAANCDRPCAGDATLTCGGAWANEVFTTGAEAEPGPDIGTEPGTEPTPTE